MTSERLIYRSLGVPDVIADESEALTAARRLREAAGLDVTVDPDTSTLPQMRRRLAPPRMSIPA